MPPRDTSKIQTTMINVDTTPIIGQREYYLTDQFAVVGEKVG